MKTIIKNDWKRYWVVAFIDFLGLFAGTNLYILLSEDLEQSTLPAMANWTWPMTGFMAAVMPVVAGLTVFKYLTKVNSVTAMHSLPLTRREHFAGHFISGFSMLILPAVLNFAILPLVAKSVTYLMIAKMLPITLLIELVIYSFTVLGAMLTGTTLMAGLGAVCLNLFIPAIVGLFEDLASRFLLGYTTTDFINEVMKFLIPMVGFSDGTRTIMAVWYIAVSVLLIIAAMIFYSKRQLENATEPMAFEFLKPLATGFVATMFSIITADMFDDGSNNIKTYIIAGIIAFVVEYLLIDMLVHKTTRVFNLKTLRNGAITFVIIAAVVACFNYDIVGYQKKVPEQNAISNIHVEAMKIGDYNSDEMFSRFENESGAFNYKVRDDNDIANIIELHTELINQAHKCDNDQICEYRQPVSITYNLKNGTKLRRYYEVQDNEYDFAVVQKIYESKEFKKSFSLKNSKLYKNEKLHKNMTADIYTEYASDNYKTLHGKELDKLIAALDKDFAKRSYAQEIKNRKSNKNIIRIIEITSGNSEYYIRVPIYKTDKNTIKYLKINK